MAHPAEPKTFTSSDAAIRYAEGLSDRHDVDVRHTARHQYTVFVDLDAYYAYGYRIWTNLA